MEELIDLISYHEAYKKKIAEMRVELVNFEQKLHEVNQKIAEKLDLNITSKVQVVKAQYQPRVQLNPGSRRLQLVEYMKDHPSVSCTDLSRALGITVNNARSVVQALVRKHLVNRDESGDYVLYSLSIHADNSTGE